jgi:hypothetical protein
MLSRYFKERRGGRRAAAKPLNYDEACRIAGEHRHLPELLRRRWTIKSGLRLNERVGVPTISSAVGR